MFDCATPRGITLYAQFISQPDVLLSTIDLRKPDRQAPANDFRSALQTAQLISGGGNRL